MVFLLYKLECKSGYCKEKRLDGLYYCVALNEFDLLKNFKEKLTHNCLYYK